MPDFIPFCKVDPEDRHLGGKYFFCVQTPLFTCAFHGPPSGILVSLTHSPILATDGALKLAILQRNVGQKWLGYMLAAESESETCMPKQAQQIEFTFHVHQVSVNERKSSNWLIQNEKFWARSRQFPICLCLPKC